MKKLLVLLLIFTTYMGVLSDDNILNLSFQGGILEIKPSTFSIICKREGKRYTITSPQASVMPIDLKVTENSIRWSREGADISIENLSEKLRVSVQGNSHKTTFPRLADRSSSCYYLPMGHGKRVPVDDRLFIEEYDNSTEKGSEFFSMSTFTNVYNKLGILYIYDNITNNQVKLYEKDERLAMDFAHAPSSLSKNPDITFDIYITGGTVYESAFIYRSTRHLVTLDEKASTNKNIEKLYGAPHFYIWGSGLKPVNIRGFKGFMKEFTSNYRKGGEVEQSIVEVFRKNAGSIEDGKSLVREWEGLLNKAEYYRYDLINLLKLLNASISLSSSPEGTGRKLAEKYSSYLDDYQEWGDGLSKSMIQDIYSSGIKNAWMGVNSVDDGIRGKGVLEYAVSLGYLIAPYDSYHSIHSPDNIGWETAAFNDKTLYKEAAITNSEGQYLTGFLGRGRKLNPLYSFDSVRYRLKRARNLEFNSWFIDVDGTGEIHDDYSKGTSEVEDARARLKRLEIIRDEYSKVIGTEGGNDFVADTAAFAHGLFTQPFGWGDRDMMVDKSSRYFTGTYYSATDEIPSRYIKRIPIKDRYIHLYYDNRYNIPLYQIVYNNVIIATNHWEWDTLKVAGQEKKLLLRGLLYNVPPMYHLNRKRWKRYRKLIVHYNNTFAPLHREFIHETITGYEVLDREGYLQKTNFSNGWEIIVNFSEGDIFHNNKKYPGESATIKGEDNTALFDFKGFDLESSS